jgi:hypothetical protein
MTTNVVDFQSAQIDREVISVYEDVISTCNKVINHANILGFHLMHIPDPNIHSIIVVLEDIIIPMLDNLSKSGNFSPESGLKISNIKQYALHLRKIALALQQGNREQFSEAVATLQKEAMLFCT